MLLAPGHAFIDGDSLAGASSIETLTLSPDVIPRILTLEVQEHGTQDLSLVESVDPSGVELLDRHSDLVIADGGETEGSKPFDDPTELAPLRRRPRFADRLRISCPVSVAVEQHGPTVDPAIPSPNLQADLLKIGWIKWSASRYVV